MEKNPFWAPLFCVEGIEVKGEEIFEDIAGENFVDVAGEVVVGRG